MLMKKSTLFSGIALMALTLVSQGLQAQDCAFTPNAFPGQAEDRTAFEVNASVHVGDGAMAALRYGRLQDLQVSNSNPADIIKAPRNMGLFFVGTGTADVTYTEFVSDRVTGDCSTNHTIHYTIAKGVPEANYVVSGEAITEYTVALNSGASGGGAEGTIGEDGSTTGSVWTPNYVMRIKKFNENTFEMEDQAVSASQITFTSSNPSVATIDANGKVTVSALGTTRITATWPGNDNWASAAASYLLKVKNPVAFYFDPVTVIDTVGNVKQRLPIMVKGDVTTFRWESSNTEVATVNAQGYVTMLKPGTTQITAYFDETDTYKGASARYYIEVVARPKPMPNISFTESQVYIELGQPYTLPTLLNPDNVAIDKWYSSDSKVVEVDESTGAVTIKGEGSAYVCCEVRESDKYSSGIFRYQVHVYTIGLVIKGITVTGANASDVLGDGSNNVVYEKQEGTRGCLHLTNWKLDASGLDNVIEFSKKTALYIYLHGESELLNATKQVIYAPEGAIVLMSEENKSKGSLKMSANGVAVNALHFKMHLCDVRVDGTNCGIKCNSLGVSKGTHLLATSASYAIQCQDFSMTEEGEEGVAILTPNVIFKAGGFQLQNGTSYSPAKVVEIGKVPVVVPDNVVTTIDFTQTDPEGNENVIFSADVNNTFNETTGQLEITTSLSDETVANALETLVPGSSAWVELLPGSIVFDIPAGMGKIEVQCLTLPGYKLKVMVNGKGSVSITSETLGWATVEYDVTMPTHVVIYLHKENGASAPARIAASLQDEDPAVGAYIQAVKITPKNAPTAIEQVEMNKLENGAKMLIDGQLFILREGRIFNANGIQVR